MDKNDLISRSALKDAFWADADNTLQYINSAEYELIMLEVDEAPAIDPEKPRPRGKWIWNPDSMGLGFGAWECSECACANDNLPIKSNNPLLFFGSAYCPSCGAKMEG